MNTIRGGENDTLTVTYIDLHTLKNSRSHEVLSNISDRVPFLIPFYIFDVFSFSKCVCGCILECIFWMIDPDGWKNENTGQSVCSQ